MAKRNVFGELMEGVAAMKGHREGKLTLRSYKIDPAPLPKVDSKLIRDTRARNCASRERSLRASCGSTKEPWRNGNRAVLNPIRKPPHWCCSFANTRTRSNDWKGWRKASLLEGQSWAVPRLCFGETWGVCRDSHLESTNCESGFTP